MDHDRLLTGMAAMAEVKYVDPGAIRITFLDFTILFIQYNSGIFK